MSEQKKQEWTDITVDKFQALLKLPNVREEQNVKGSRFIYLTDQPKTTPHRDLVIATGVCIDAEVGVWQYRARVQ